MSWGNKGRGGGRGSRRPLELGMTPLIDIVFLLLIFFMLTSRFVSEEGIRVDLPQTQAAHTLPPRDDLIVFLKEDGRLHFEGRFYSLDEFHSLLARRGSAFLDKPLEIRADRWAPVQSMVSLLEVLRRFGARKVTVGTVEAPGPPARREGLDAPGVSRPNSLLTG